MSDPSRERFEEEYKDWLLSTARDAARIAATMSRADIDKLVQAYNRLRNPKAVFTKISNTERLERLAGERLSSFILVETEAITFFPSLQYSIPGVLDFAVALNRHFFCQDLWFPIISLNSQYIKRSSDKVLSFALQHEFEMSSLYQEISMNLRFLSRDEKREVADSAHKRSAQKLSITQEELIEDERLMIRLSKIQPLIPKPYAEMALLLYLEENQPELKGYGVPSISEEERSFGKELYEEFRVWSDFARSTYSIFVRELLASITEASRAYQ